MDYKDRLALWHNIDKHIKKLKIIEYLKIGSVFTLGMTCSIGLDPMFMFPTFYYFLIKSHEPLDHNFYNRIKDTCQTKIIAQRLIKYFIFSNK